MTGEHRSTFGRQLVGKVAPEVLQAATLGCDDDAEPVRVPEQVEQVLARRVYRSVWGDDVALGAIVLGVRGYDGRTIEHSVRRLHAGFTVLARASPFITMQDWDPTFYLSATTSGVAVSRAHQSVLVAFWRRYALVTLEVERWLYRLAEADQRVYRRFVMPTVAADLIQGLSTR